MLQSNHERLVSVPEPAVSAPAFGMLQSSHVAKQPCETCLHERLVSMPPERVLCVFRGVCAASSQRVDSPGASSFRREPRKTDPWFLTIAEAVSSPPTPLREIVGGVGAPSALQRSGGSGRPNPHPPRAGFLGLGSSAGALVPDREKKATRRKPGRPPSRPRPEPIPVRGIVDRPMVEGRCLEYVHQNPVDFMNFENVLKKNKLDEVYFEFGPDRAIVASADTPRDSPCPDLLDVRCKAFMVIDPSRANSYYLQGGRRRWRLKREVLEPIFHSSDQTLTKVTFYVQAQFPGFLTIRYDDPHLEKECIHELTLPSLDDSPESVPAGLFDYASRVLYSPLGPLFPVRFKLGAGDIKKTVNDAKRHEHVEHIQIVLAPGRDLEFQYFNQGVSSYVEKYRNCRKISLESDVSERERFGIKVRLTELASATASLKNDVQILCGSGRNGMLFRLDRGQGVGLNVFIKAEPA